MSTSGVNFSGLSSGLDTASIISKYVSIARQPQTIYKAQQTALQNKQTAYNTVSAKLIAFQLSAQTLNKLRAFNAVIASTSDATVATATAVTGTQAGAYNLNVSSLATAQVLSSTAQSSQTAALGFSGQIVINGKAVTISASDNLQNVAADINGAGAGVTASIIQPTPGQFFLTIGSNSTGVQGAISLSDTAGGTFLSKTLGVLDSGGATTLKNAIGTTGANSDGFTNAGTSIGTLLGLSHPAAGTVVIEGQAVNIDLAQDSLATIASKITAAGIPGVAAQVVSATDPTTSVVTQKLQITGTQNFSDANGVLNALGVTKTAVGAGRQTTAAADATFTLNGLTATRPTNSFSDAVSGLTVNLVKTGSATITVASDTATIKSEINAYAAAFNDVVNTVQNNAQYDTATKTAGVLFGDSTTETLVDSLTSGVTGAVANLGSGKINNLADIGVTLGQDGTLSVDDTKLSNALSGNLGDIGRLFRADGVTSSNQVTFVSTGPNTKASPKDGYAVNITQPATQATFTAATAQTGALAQDETITFGGALFGTSSASNPLSGGHSISLAAGISLADVVATINADTTVSKQVTASIVDGKLTLASKAYGSAAQFYVGSGVADQKNGTSSGIGTAPQKAAGLDVAGTINGETATGVGQYLTGSQNVTTQAAAKATFSATAQTGNLTQDETLTFGGSLFGVNSLIDPLTGGHSLTLKAGSSLAQVVAAINADTTVSSHLTASAVNGQLTLTSRYFGASQKFAVGSSVADAKDGKSTGIGKDAQEAAGLDAQQESFGKTNGLQLLITGTTKGSYGTALISAGVASFGDSFVTAETDGYTGNLTQATSTAQKTYNDIGQTISDLETRVTAYQAQLQQEFNHLEAVVGQLKSTSNALTSFTNATSSSNSNK